MTHPRISLRRFALLATFVAAGILLGSPLVLPAAVRFLGLLVLGGLFAWLWLAPDSPSHHL